VVVKRCILALAWSFVGDGSEENVDETTSLGGIRALVLASKTQTSQRIGVFGRVGGGGGAMDGLTSVFRSNELNPVRIRHHGTYTHLLLVLVRRRPY
jgi:hypothetical protein